MRIGIDASNLRSGGGVTHLVELLNAAQPDRHDFSQMIVWSGTSTLDRLAERPWLSKVRDPLLDRPLPFRLYWQRFRLEHLARVAGCDVLFVPGGSYIGRFHPFVTMSRNMLPFAFSEARRYGFHGIFIKLLLLRRSQATSFKKADGVIFLTNYARIAISQAVDLSCVPCRVIPHGVSNRFRLPPRPPSDAPFRILYISTVAPYKHQWQVVHAVAHLRHEGIEATLDLIGSAHPTSLGRLKETIAEIDPKRDFVRYHGYVPHDRIMSYYQEADIFVFASTVENMPNILLEAMAAGLPIVSSARGPMPEVLGNCGIYINPEEPQSIARGLRHLLLKPDQRYEYAQKAHLRARRYTWERCADETFAFLRQTVRRANRVECCPLPGRLSDLHGESAQSNGD